MAEQSGTTSREVEPLKHFYAAVNRNDMDAMAEMFDPDVVRVEFEGFPTGGTYRGIEAVRDNVSAGRGTWAEGSCNPEKFFVNGDNVVVYVHAWVRLKDTPHWAGGRFADGFAFRDGKIVEYHSFAERNHALKWAGLEDRESS